MRRVRLNVVLDSVAALRQRRLSRDPDPVAVALLAEQAGADGVTLRLRADRAEIQDRDVELVAGAVRGALNLRVSVSEELLGIAVRVNPARCCIVPEQRHDHAAGGGLDAVRLQKRLAEAARRLREAGIEVAARIDPDAEQVAACANAGLEAVELYCGAYSLATGDEALEKRLMSLRAAMHSAAAAGLNVYAGGGLHYGNVMAVAALGEIGELRIGHAIIANAVSIGLGASIAQMNPLLWRDGVKP